MFKKIPANERKANPSKQHRAHQSINQNADTMFLWFFPLLLEKPLYNTEVVLGK